MPSKFKIEVRAELRNPQGKLIKRLPWKKANSLLKGFIQILMAQMSGVSQTVKDTGGTDRAVIAAVKNFCLAAAATETPYGIAIGTGTTAVTMTDNKLETQVTTNIVHAAPSFAVENPDTSTWRVAIARVFTNNTGASLGIREVALYGQATASLYNICVDRTLYSVDVPSGVGVTLTYRITVSL